MDGLTFLIVLGGLATVAAILITPRNESSRESD